jgi:hypothetical protein
MRITDKAKELAEKTSGAYSYDRFKNWDAVIQMLLNKGYSDREVEAIVRSKWTRWACDGDTSKNRYGYHTSKCLESFMKGTTQKEVDDLVNDTFFN